MPALGQSAGPVRLGSASPAGCPFPSALGRGRRRAPRVLPPAKKRNAPHRAAARRDVLPVRPFRYLRPPLSPRQSGCPPSLRVRSRFALSVRGCASLPPVAQRPRVGRGPASGAGSRSRPIISALPAPGRARPPFAQNAHQERKTGYRAHGEQMAHCLSPAAAGKASGARFARRRSPAAPLSRAMVLSRRRAPGCARASLGAPPLERSKKKSARREEGPDLRSGPCDEEISVPRPPSW